MKTIDELSEQIAIDHNYYDNHGLQRIDLEIACREMARQMEEWIDVEDELPEEIGDYLVKDEYGNVRVSFLNRNFREPQFELYGDNGTDDYKITHWRPINRKYQ